MGSGGLVSEGIRECCCLSYQPASTVRLIGSEKQFCCPQLKADDLGGDRDLVDKPGRFGGNLKRIFTVLRVQKALGNDNQDLRTLDRISDLLGNSNRCGQGGRGSG